MENQVAVSRVLDVYGNYIRNILDACDEWKIKKDDAVEIDQFVMDKMNMLITGNSKYTTSLNEACFEKRDHNNRLHTIQIESNDYKEKMTFIDRDRHFTIEIEVNFYVAILYYKGNRTIYNLSKYED